MSEHNFQQLRSGQAGCPSDLMLDRMHTGELAPAAAESLAQHIASCQVCPGRMESRKAGFEAFARADPERLLAGVRKRLAEPERAPQTTWAPPQRTPQGWMRSARVLYAATPLAAAAALTLVFVMNRGSIPIAEEPGADTVRLKGGPALHVFRLAGERTQPVMSGERLSPGDRLRFVVDLPKEGQVTIVGVERDGKLYTAWPLGAQTASVNASATQRPAGLRQELPGAVALDESEGQEPLYLVYCPEQSAAPRCTSKGATDSPACPAGCVLQKFVINKGR